MSNELGIIQNVDDLGRIGNMMAQSGYFVDARDAAQASVKVLAGQEMGFGAFASMTGIYIIKGKPSIGANLMASAVKSNPKYDYRVREMTDKICTIEFFEFENGKKESIGVSTFTIEDARKAGTQNLEKYARNMLFARAMSNGVKWFCPDIFSGNAAYTPEELGAEVDGEGNVIKIDEAPKAAMPVLEAQAEAIEGEIIEPNNTPESKKPAETQEKPKFDEHEFLRGWEHKSGLPAITLENAGKIENSEGVPYAQLSVERLFYMQNAILKKMSQNLAPEIADGYKLKLSAINEILTAKANALKAMEINNGGE